jgi:hypothetical protein
MESEITLTYVDYDPMDYDLVEAWCTAHDRRPPSPEALPAAGVIVMHEEEAMAMLFLYMDITSNIGIVDWAITRPGLTMDETRAALLYALEGPVAEIAREGGCTMLTCYALKGLARNMEATGWTVERREIFNMSKML